VLVLFDQTQMAEGRDMLSNSRRGVGVVAGGALFAMLATGAIGIVTAAAAEQVGVFITLSGDWAGDGTVNTNSGTTERIRCRASYVVNKSGDNLQQELRCASDSYKFEVSSTMIYDNGAIKGTWAERNENVIGELNGLVYPDRISGGVHGSLFTAKVAVMTDGSRQSVNIEPTGTSIKAISIRMNKK
jgi:hypothetical protein